MIKIPTIVHTKKIKNKKNQKASQPIELKINIKSNKCQANRT